MNYQEKTDALYHEQAKNWPLMATNLEGLKSAQLKTFQFDGFSIHVQFNPKRITSSAAKVDKDSINKRKCFLCAENRPQEQNEVPFEDDYEILCNPFPIFKEHYTIAHKEHIPQEINNEFPRFLALSKALPKLVVFYNAPKCGASAPDHLHFQAGNLGFVPVEEDLPRLKLWYGDKIINQQQLQVTAIDDGLRRFVVLESENVDSLSESFKAVYEFAKNLESGEEPMMNILGYYNQGWRVFVFLRDKHRPWQFFEKGEHNIVLSPASVDMGGTLITPLQKDFENISKENVIDIFNQVSMSPLRFVGLKKHIVNELV